MTFGPINSWSNYLPQEFQLPVDEIDFREFISQRERQTADVLNLKENGQYEDGEILTGQTWFTTANNQTKRYTYRKAFNIGAIASGATATIAHGITNILYFTRISGGCVTDVVDYRPIPYSSVANVNLQIQVNVAGANLVIVNGAASPNITAGVVVLEYFKI